MKFDPLTCLYIIVLLVFAPVEAGEIHEAARINDLPAVKKLVGKNPKLVASQDNDRRTALHLAARYGDQDTVRFLISKGADVNAQCYNQFTPLHLTSDPKIAKVLIESGADLKSKAVTGTPLEDAVSDENLAVIDLLLKAGEKLDLDSLVTLGRTNRVAEVLKEKPWMAKAPRKVLHTACSHGHMEITRLLLKNGADPNVDFGFSNVFGVYSPFSSAVTSGHFEVAKLLCEYGVDTNVSGGKMYDSLFHYAVGHRDARFVKLMLEQGANVHATNHDQSMTPLHAAASVGDVEKVSLLLKYKADVNAATTDGATPLMFAATLGHTEVSRLLISKGARLDIHTASALGRPDDVQRFLKGNPRAVNRRDKRLRRTPLFFAVQLGHVRLVRFLLDSGAEVNLRAPRYSQASNVVTGPEIWNHEEKDVNGETPLHVAAGRDNAQIVQLLLKAGAVVNAQSNKVTPLHRAVHAERPTIVRLLLQHGAKVDGPDKYGSTLRGARDNREIMKLLLASKPNQVSLDAALSSVTDENKAVGELLLKAGAQADIYAASRFGLVGRVRELLKVNPRLANRAQSQYPRERAINVAAANGHLEIVRVLTENGAELQPKDDICALTAAARHGKLAVARFLLDHGARLNRKDSMGTTPLHSASRAGQVEMVRFLVKRGAKLRATDVYRDSVLHTAAVGGHPDVLAFLISLKMPVDIQNERGETPLHKAVFYGHIEVARTLIKHRANVNAKNHRGQTPLFYAERKRHPLFYPDRPNLKSLAALLRKHGGKK